MSKNYVQLFVEAVYPGNAELALASFSERQCLEEATARIRELEAALRMYGEHLPQCETANNSFGLPCNCGFDAALAPSAQDRKGEP